MFTSKCFWDPYSGCQRFIFLLWVAVRLLRRNMWQMVCLTKTALPKTNCGTPGVGPSVQDPWIPKFHLPRIIKNQGGGWWTICSKFFQVVEIFMKQSKGKGSYDALTMTYIWSENILTYKMYHMSSKKHLKTLKKVAVSSILAAEDINVMIHVIVDCRVWHMPFQS